MALRRNGKRHSNSVKFGDQSWGEEGEQPSFEVAVIYYPRTAGQALREDIWRDEDAGQVHPWA